MEQSWLGGLGLQQIGNKNSKHRDESHVGLAMVLVERAHLTKTYKGVSKVSSSYGLSVVL